uniref:Uncharacterized protein n=1 Tax=Octopus bimaculoides TaxID=37653 RepID=A0A0L8FPR2_OCTBM
MEFPPHCQIMFVCGAVLATANRRRQGHLSTAWESSSAFCHVPKRKRKNKKKDKHTPCNKGSLCGLPLPISLENKCTALSGGSRYYIV